MKGSPRSKPRASRSATASYCADLSRSRLCGDGRPSDRQRDLYRAGIEQLAFNLELIRPGLSFLELSARAFQLPEWYRANRCSVICHGIGLADEYPAIYYPKDSAAAGYDGVLRENITVCLESYIDEEAGPEGIRLEQQVLITERGCKAPLELSLGRAAVGLSHAQRAGSGVLEAADQPAMPSQISFSPAIATKA